MLFCSINGAKRECRREKWRLLPLTVSHIVLWKVLKGTYTSSFHWLGGKNDLHKSPSLNSLFIWTLPIRSVFLCIGPLESVTCKSIEIPETEEKLWKLCPFLHQFELLFPACQAGFINPLLGSDPCVKESKTGWVWEANEAPFRSVVFALLYCQYTEKQGRKIPKA